MKTVCLCEVCKKKAVCALTDFVQKEAKWSKESDRGEEPGIYRACYCAHLELLDSWISPTHDFVMPLKR